MSFSASPPQTSRTPPETITPIIQAHALVKRYGNHLAVAGIDLAIHEREIFGILGPNGAGKTTTLEMIEGLRTPDAGTIRVAGLDAVAQSLQVRRIIGVQLQTTALFDHLSAAELIDLFAGLYDVPAPRGYADQLLAVVDLGEKRDARVDQMSGGQQQRLSIALALVNRPKIVFLDEPTTGLDPQARRNLWATVRRIRTGGVTVVLTTHYMEEAERLCDRVAVMDRGRVIACDTPLALIRALDIAATVRARVSGGHLPPADLRALPGVIWNTVVGDIGIQDRHAPGTGNAAQPGDIDRSGDSIAANESGGVDTPEILLRTRDAQATLTALLALAARHGVTLTNLASTQANLEDVFLSLTGRAYDNETATEAETRKGDRGRARRRSKHPSS